MTPNVAGDSITRPDSPPRSGSSECSFTNRAELIKNKLLNRKKPTKTSVNGVAPVNEIEPADAKYTVEEAEEKLLNKRKVIEISASRGAENIEFLKKPNAVNGKKEVKTFGVPMILLMKL